MPESIMGTIATLLCGLGACLLIGYAIKRVTEMRTDSGEKDLPWETESEQVRSELHYLYLPVSGPLGRLCEMTVSRNGSSTNIIKLNLYINDVLYKPEFWVKACLQLKLRPGKSGRWWQIESHEIEWIKLDWLYTYTSKYTFSTRTYGNYSADSDQRVLLLKIHFPPTAYMEADNVVVVIPYQAVIYYLSNTNLYKILQ